MGSLRATLEKIIAPVIATSIATYLRFAYRTTTWQSSGSDEMYRIVEQGKPVIIVCWHQRLMYAPVSWDRSKGEACTLRSTSQAGRISGGVQRRLGFLSVAMADEDSNFSSSRQVAKLMKKGVTLGITADGPEGPNRILNSAVLEWARLSGAPIFMFSFATRGHWLWNTWDKLMFPKPFTKGVLVHKRWDQTVPRKPSADDLESLRKQLEDDLNTLTAKTDQAIAEL